MLEITKIEHGKGKFVFLNNSNQARGRIGSLGKKKSQTWTNMLDDLKLKLFERLKELDTFFNTS